MNEATYFEQKRFRPGSLAMVLGLHATFITAAVAWKVDVVRLVERDVKVRPDSRRGGGHRKKHRSRIELFVVARELIAD